jgi:flagellar motility protein MotE (MotC chaperone)
VDAKIAQLKQLQAQITQLLGQRDEAQKAQIAALVKTYSTMKPKDAARIFNDLPDDVLVPVAREMKSDQLALVLASMSPDNAKSLTVKLANRLILPQATAVAPPASPAPAATTPAAPVPAAAKAPVTGQNQATPKT